MSKVKIRVKDIEFVTKDNKIDLDALEAAFNSILNDAKKAFLPRGAAAARRFRVNTVELSKHFLPMRDVTPKPEQ